MANSRLIIVDDHPMVRDALRLILTDSFKDTEIQEAGTLDRLQELLSEDRETELVLLDLTVPSSLGLTGIAGLLHIRKEHPHIPVIVVSANDDPDTIRRCMDFGAFGFVPKSLAQSEIRSAIRTVLAGGEWLPPDFDRVGSGDTTTRDLAARLSTLTPQQIRVLGMLGDGLLNKQIAFKLNVSEATIKAHVSAILQKLDVDSRTQAVIAINKSGLAGWPKSTK
jgi:DNA-binding NarL/FixJ family response regulator